MFQASILPSPHERIHPHRVHQILEIIMCWMKAFLSLPTLLIPTQLLNAFLGAKINGNY